MNEREVSAAAKLSEKKRRDEGCRGTRFVELPAETFDRRTPEMTRREPRADNRVLAVAAMSRDREIAELEELMRLNRVPTPDRFWLGGKMIERPGAAFHDGAHLKAPSSPSNRPASENAKEG